MRVFDFSFLCSIFLIGVSLAHGTKASSSQLRGHETPNKARSLQIRTDLIRLIPFQVQIAIQDETTPGESQIIEETLYQGGSLLTDTITDWMMASFIVKTTNDQAEQLLVNNYTSFDSIALELVDDATSSGIIDGQELNLVQVSFEGVSLWERQGTGTPPMEPEIVELIQRATFLEDRSLKASMQNSINQLLFGLGVEREDGAQAITIVDVRAYISPPSSLGDDDEEEPPSSGSTETSSQTNKNLEIIIIVAIVVACLAFALLVFAVIWAWRSDRKDRDEKPSSSSKKQKRASKAKSDKSGTGRFSKKGKESNNKMGKTEKMTSATQPSRYQPAVEEPDSSIEPMSSYDLPNNQSYDSYPSKVIAGENGHGAPADDSIVSEDISSSLTAYYKSGMAYSGSKGGSTTGRPAKDFNDAASMSSMDSYGYSLDGYAPSLGPAQGGYPVGLMQAARDAPMPVGDEPDLKHMQDDESVDDYDSELIGTA